MLALLGKRWHLIHLIIQYLLHVLLVKRLTNDLFFFFWRRAEARDHTQGLTHASLNPSNYYYFLSMYYDMHFSALLINHIKSCRNSFPRSYVPVTFHPGMLGNMNTGKKIECWRVGCAVKQKAVEEGNDKDGFPWEAVQGRLRGPS